MSDILEVEGGQQWMGLGRILVLVTILGIAAALSPHLLAGGGSISVEDAMLYVYPSLIALSFVLSGVIPFIVARTRTDAENALGQGALLGGGCGVLFPVGIAVTPMIAASPAGTATFVSMFIAIIPWTALLGVVLGLVGSWGATALSKSTPP